MVRKGYRSMKKRKWTCLLNIITILYMWAIISDLFSQENYKINSYIVDDIATLVIVWLVPLIACILLFRNQEIKQKLSSNRGELVALALIFLAGISHRLLSIVYGLIIPADMVILFKYEPSIERVVFAILQTSILAIKFLGFALALRLGIKQVGIQNYQIHNWSGILVLVISVGFVVFLVRDIKALLPYYY